MTARQKDIFLDREADSWNERNQIVGDKLTDKRRTDLALKTLLRVETPPKRVLEIGASNGWRLSVLKESWPDTEFVGIDPSKQAVSNAYEGIELHHGTAENLPFDDNEFDMVLFGFCLYLCDRKDLFRIAAEADRVLMDSGLMVTYDFHTEVSYRNPYAHQEGMYTYKMDYSQLFNWSPAYHTIDQSVAPFYEDDEDIMDNRVGVFVLQKNLTEGWPNRPEER